MADQPIRVMFRFHVGVPYRQASDEARAQYWAQIKQVFAEWKSSGVKLVGYFGSYGNGFDGYAHHMILDVPEITMVRKMNGDIFGLGGIYEKNHFEVGAGGAGEELWESA
jgi:hypothetical protein